MDSLRFHLERGFSKTVPVGVGSEHIVSGWWFHPSKRLRSLWLTLGDARHPIQQFRDLRLDVASVFAAEDQKGASLLSGFYGLVPLGTQLLEQTLPFGLHFDWHDGTSDTRMVGQTTIVGRSPAGDLAEPRTKKREAALAICLATYNPTPQALARQVDSIINQTYRDWICIVNDDCSAPEAFREIQAICGRDPRFRVERNASNVGFYRNYEIALWRALASGAEFAALADQDDYWYPFKLERTLQAFQDSSTLVYCDMRIVRPSGAVVSDTYWFSRRNNHTDADVIFLANTVTGAASVFRASLLPKVLPFPDPIGDCFHDHWISCCALAAGTLSYVDEPLYDYIQHDSNVIGHCAFEPHPWIRSMLDSWRAFRSGASLRELVRRSVLHSIAVYSSEYRRLELFGRTLQLRFDRVQAGCSGAIRLTDGTWASVARLLGANLRYRVTGSTTGSAEIRLALGFVVAKLTSPAVNVLRRRLIRRIRTNQTTTILRRAGSPGREQPRGGG